MHRLHGSLGIALAVAARPVLVIARNPPTKTFYAARNLGTLGGTQSAAFGINNLGWVTGAANLEGDQTEHPVLWRNGSVIDLGTLGGDNGSAGFPLTNNLGVVPAFAQTSETDPLGENWNFTCSLSGNLCQGTDLVQHGFLWLGGRKLSMPTLGGHNSAAWGANDWGEIVGQGIDSSGTAAAAFLLVPCGEDGTDAEKCELSTQNEAGMKKPKIVLPEIVRQQLRRMSLIGRLATR